MPPSCSAACSLLRFSLIPLQSALWPLVLLEEVAQWTHRLAGKRCEFMVAPFSSEGSSDANSKQ